MESETLIGNAVAGRRKEFFLFTKLGHDGKNLGGADWDRATLEKSIDRSLQRLRTDCVDLLQLHSCELELLKRGEVIEVVERARQAGKTRFIGYSGDGAAAKFAVDCGRFDALQTSVSIADQEAIDLSIAPAAARGMGVIAKRPIANAAWRYGATRPENSYHAPYWERLQALQYRFPDMAETALRFTLSVPGVTTAIVGTKNPARWTSNAALAQKGPLPKAEYDDIRAQWRQVARPDWGGET